MVHAGATYGAVSCSLLLPHCHLPVVEHSPYIVIQRRSLLVERLRENVDLMLQVCPLLSNLLVLQTAVILDFLPQLGARRPEQVAFLFDR